MDILLMFTITSCLFIRNPFNVIYDENLQSREGQEIPLNPPFAKGGIFLPFVKGDQEGFDWIPAHKARMTYCRNL